MKTTYSPVPSKSGSINSKIFPANKTPFLSTFGDTQGPDNGGPPVAGSIANTRYPSGTSELAILWIVGMFDGLSVTSLTKVLGCSASFTTTFGSTMTTLP